jgi:hypothetical protein
MFAPIRPNPIIPICMSHLGEKGFSRSAPAVSHAGRRAAL